MDNSSQYKVAIVTDSISTLSSIQSVNSCRQDILLEIPNQIYRLHNTGVDVSFLWVPAHVGVERNEEADILPQTSTKIKHNKHRNTIKQGRNQIYYQSKHVHNLAGKLG